MRHLMYLAAVAALFAAAPRVIRAESPAAPRPIAATRWTADVSDARPRAVRAMRGASHLLEARLSEGRGMVAIPDGSTASMLWQTNGMGSAWWSVPAAVASNAVSAVWTPEMDCGASAYRVFLRVDAPGGADYSAFATLLMLDSPGAVPNELSLPAKKLDFSAIETTNAPWATSAEVGSAIEAAIEEIPPPDLSSRVSKGGDTMSGTLTVPWITLQQQGVRADLDPIEFRLDTGTKLGRNKITVCDQYGNRVEITRGYIEVIPAGQEWGDLFNWPSRTGTLALVEDIPQASPVYADPAPWRLSLAMLPADTATSTYVATNAGSDVGAEMRRAATYSDAQLFVETDDRPPPYSYAAPTGTWSIVSDPAGAASGISAGGLLSSSMSTSGAVVVRYDAGDAGSRTLNVWMSQSSRAAATGRLAEIPGTFRHACQTNLLARLAAVDPDGPRSRYGLQYAGTNTDHVALHDILDALSPYNDLGDALAAPTAINPDFFWPELADALRCESVGRSDHPNWWTYAPVLAIAPHFAVTAAHWNFAPTAKFCASREGSGTFVTCRPLQRWIKPGTDLALIQYRDEIPAGCIARLCPSNTLARLSPSLFSKAVGVTSSQHDTVHPFVVGGGNRQDWMVAGYEAATNAIHYVHGGDSGHVYGIVTPRAQFIPFGCFHTAGGGPALYDAENIDWLDARMSAAGESVTEWTYAELSGEDE